MLNFIFNTFLMLVVVLDPIGLAPIFMGLTHGGSDEYRKRMAIKGTVIAGFILLLFVAAGGALLRALGIGLPAFRIAGGALLFLLAIDMLFARHSGLRSTTSQEQKEAEQRADISVFPLAIPLIAGPGALTTLLLMMGGGHDGTGPHPLNVIVVVVVLIVVLLLTLAALLLAGRIVVVMGETGANVVSRLLGVLLAALAVQYIIDGVRTGLMHVGGG